MKKIGREVLFLPTGKGNPRNGEGAMIRLRDGRIMYAYTRYYGDDWTDHATACIAAYYSSDEGETWSDGGVLVEKDAEALNIMSVSLLRMQNGDLGLICLRKAMKGDALLCMPYLLRSSDEGKTFGAPVCCAAEEGYYVVNNDRILRHSCGRLLLPAAYHGASGKVLFPGQLVVFFSDDDGVTWQASARVCSPYEDNVRLQEPGIFEMPNGRVLLWCRTAYGHQYHCFSEDGGEHFGRIAPLFRFTSPDSPMQIKAVDGCTVAIFNPVPYHCLRTDRELWKSPKRTPLVCAVSRDGGPSFTDATVTSSGGGFDAFVDGCFLLEDDTTNSYCYPSVQAVKDGFLVSYYHSNGTNICLNAAKVIKINCNEIL